MARNRSTSKQNGRVENSTAAKLSKAHISAIDKAVKVYENNLYQVELAASALRDALWGDPTLKSYIHFIKSRAKEPSHLRDKLFRKAVEAVRRGKRPEINADNLFQRITDVAGVRVIHLYSDQFSAMHSRIMEILSEQNYRLVETPVAHCWDHLAEGHYKGLGLRAIARDTMYTSVHYTIEGNSQSKICCELQVRTLAEEIWGEVSHTINYPHATLSVACKEQLMVLARATSTCSRLVDSLFRSRDEFSSLATRPTEFIPKSASRRKR